MSQHASCGRFLKVEGMQHYLSRCMMAEINSVIRFVQKDIVDGLLELSVRVAARHLSLLYAKCHDEHETRSEDDKPLLITTSVMSAYSTPRACQTTCCMRP
eukprot:1696366-Amphidinium_carterae.1